MSDYKCKICKKQTYHWSGLCQTCRKTSGQKCRICDAPIAMAGSRKGNRCAACDLHLQRTSFRHENTTTQVYE